MRSLMRVTKRVWGVGAVLGAVVVAWQSAMAAAPSQTTTASQTSGVFVRGLPPTPPQPGEDAWTFVADLKSPLWTTHAWTPRAAAAGEVDLRAGVQVVARFPDSEGLLQTAYADLREFLAAGKVSQKGDFVIETGETKPSRYEAYRIEVTSDRCRILAADTEGIRRGIFHVEDMMRRAGGPLLRLGACERAPFIKTRISRSFFSAKDELKGDVDYYPDQYLNRLAHDGVNALWISIRFRDLCRTSVVPEFGRDAERRLAKLAKNVEKCRWYGIRMYLYGDEPAAWNSNDSVLQSHPDAGGAVCDARLGRRFVCPSSPAVQRYLYEATNSIFKAVPRLGGLIVITHGEGHKTCLTSMSASRKTPASCPACRKKEPWEIARDTLAPMAKGIHDASPKAEFITWFYEPQETEPTDWVYEIPKHLPENVTLQFNFESGVVKEVFGKGRKGGDYWLSVPGPSPRFERMARQSQEAGVPLSAKIQTSCSHEVATIPFVPVPGNLYRKFRAMRELGVTRVMLCWTMGSYPGLMNKAAGELSFEPLPQTEDEFLRQLAGREWGEHAETVAGAWRQFADGYAHFPLTTSFQYYGPMHDGVVWPLLLRPQDVPLARTWAVDSTISVSGDRVGDAVGTSYALAEAIESCRMLSDGWDEGVKTLQAIEGEPALSRQQRLDIGVARALGIQFRTGLNILRFYDLRERMAHESTEEQFATLKEMRAIVEAELESGTELIALCESDSRLGYHSHVPGYKYFPEKIRWRMDQLQGLLDRDMPALEAEIRSGVDVFAEYTGRAPQGPTAHSCYRADAGRSVRGDWKDLRGGLEWQTSSAPAGDERDGSQMRWACCHDRESLYVLLDCTADDPKAAKPSRVVLTVEPRRMAHWLEFSVSAGNGQIARPPRDFESQARPVGSGWQGWMRVPWVAMGVEPVDAGPLRINVCGVLPDGRERAWIERRRAPIASSLLYKEPGDLGWLCLERRSGGK